MKLSKETLAVLKNFSIINSNLILLEGSKLSTLSYDENILGYAEIAEELPSDFGIYDLSEFLGALSLFEDPELEFNDKFVEIKGAGQKIKYFATDSGLLKIPALNGNEPTIVAKFPDEGIKFTLTAEQMNMVTKTASVLKSADISIVGDGTKLNLIVGDRKNPTANKYEIELGETDEDFVATVKVAYLKLIPGSYEVHIIKQRASKWTNENTKLTYFVTLGSDSKFN